MSTESLHTFIGAIDDSLAREACKAIDGSSDPSRFVDLGRSRGYDFTNEEVISYFNDADDSSGGYNRLATGVSMFRRMGRINMVPRWVARMYSFSVQADMRFW
jgi:hypothetical protein